MTAVRYASFQSEPKEQSAFSIRRKNAIFAFEYPLMIDVKHSADVTDFLEGIHCYEWK